MPTLTFNSIECAGTKETKHDEIYINAYGESSGAILGRNTRLPVLWGPTRMEEGDILSLRGAIDPIVFYEFAQLKLWDDDSPFRDDHISTLHLRRPFTYGEDLPWNIPHTGMLTAVGAGPAYQIRYNLLEEPSIALSNVIVFVSLECNNAQRTMDRIRLYANSELIWGPHEMRTNDEEIFDRLYYKFHNQLLVELYEDRLQHYRRWLGLREGEYQNDSTLTHVFEREGDFQYTLRYIMRSIPAI